MKADFGEILRNRRTRLGMKQEELARRIGMDHTYISKLESGKGNPAYNLITKICDGLGLTLEEFFGGGEETGSEPAILEVYRGKESKRQVKEYRIKTKLAPVRVVKGLVAFSQVGKIEEEFISKYVYVEKEMTDRFQNLIGVEIDKDIVLASMKFKKTIFLVDTKEQNIDSPGFYIIQFPESRDVAIMRTEIKGDKIVFFEEATSEKQKFPSYFPEHYNIYDKSELEAGSIKGKVVGISGRL